MATTLYHPTIPDVEMPVDDDKVDAWKAAGWLAEAPDLSAAAVAAQSPTAAAAPTSKPKPATKAELVATAERLGLDTSGTKADLAKRIAAHEAAQTPQGAPEVDDDAPAAAEGDQTV
jgi:hypothetical protein